VIRYYLINRLIISRYRHYNLHIIETDVSGNSS
jgi:hypothetical protein